MEKPEPEYLSVRLPRGLEEKMAAAIGRGEYVNKSDLVRDALRKLLEGEA